MSKRLINQTGRQSQRAIVGTRGRRRMSKSTTSNVYDDMLNETIGSSAHGFGQSDRPVKRRRTGQEPTIKSEPAAGRDEEQEGSMTKKRDHENDTGASSAENAEAASKGFQTAYDDSESSDQDDVGWEEVNLDGQVIEKDDSKNDTDADLDLDLVLDDAPAGANIKGRLKRKPVTNEERKRRIGIHQMHLLCLMAHVEQRNDWCNDRQIQAALRPLLPKHTVEYLQPDQSASQFTLLRMMNEGLQQAIEIWKERFSMTARGLRRCAWAADEDGLRNYKVPSDVDPPLDKDDFRKVARRRKGSRDVGAQLFCAMLRSVGLQTRLVCSLQALPSTVTAAKATRPTGLFPDRMISDCSNGHLGGAGPDLATRRSDSTKGGEPTSPLRPHPTANPKFQSQRPTPRRIVESRHPIYWVEVFAPSHSKWIPVDPLVTLSVGKASQFEPPGNDTLNTMTYVLAYESDNVVHDVTRRYTKAYLAKTRRCRIEATPAGASWLAKALLFYSRGYDVNRDTIEKAELAKREAQEPMPRNVQDFKSHPLYALERHLKRHEVILSPKQEVGKIAGGKNKQLESIYRRRDVAVVRSADHWYRVGREILPGAQPLKRVAPRRTARNRSTSPIDDEKDPDNSEGTALYAESQTELYVPAPVVNGLIPKNIYGNLDIYVPSMVPPGGVHIQDIETKRAARLLAIDHADAVTGFEFKGRQGTAVVKGAVVAKEYEDAVRAVIQGFRDAEEDDRRQKRTEMALKAWRLFFRGLRIQQRVKGYEIEGELHKGIRPMTDAVSGGQDGGGFIPDGEDAQEQGGGFVPERTNDMIAVPTASDWTPGDSQNDRSPQEEVTDEEDDEMYDEDEATRNEPSVESEPSDSPQPDTSKPVITRRMSLSKAELSIPELLRQHTNDRGTSTPSTPSTLYTDNDDNDTNTTMEHPANLPVTFHLQTVISSTVPDYLGSPNSSSSSSHDSRSPQNEPSIPHNSSDQTLIPDSISTPTSALNLAQTTDPINDPTTSLPTNLLSNPMIHPPTITNNTNQNPTHRSDADPHNPPSSTAFPPSIPDRPPHHDNHHRPDSPSTSSIHESLDRGSLLSEDPDDEDAEPEWLI